jgi:hypothetical protein
MEGILLRLPITREQIIKINEYAKEMLKFEIEDIRIDLEEPNFYIRKDGEWVNLCTLGSGEQSVISVGMALV